MKKYIILAAAAIVLAACTNDDNYIDEPVAARFTAIIGESAVTRASDKSWGEDDQIGITMEGRYVNMKYTTENGNGIFTGTTMYFKNKREPVTLTAYYPFAGTESVAPEIVETSTSVENQTSEKQPNIDFLFARKEDVKGEQPQVQFEFSHQMSKLSFIINNGVGVNDIKIVSYKIEGLTLQGTFNPLSGVCVAKTDSESETLSGETDGDLPSLIVFPQDLSDKKVLLTITDNEGQQYTCNLSFKGNKIESGNNYQWTITVNKTGLTVNESSITNWMLVDSTTGADSYYPIVNISKTDTEQ